MKRDNLELDIQEQYLYEMKVLVIKLCKFNMNKEFGCCSNVVHFKNGPCYMFIPINKKVIHENKIYKVSEKSFRGFESS